MLGFYVPRQVIFPASLVVTKLTGKWFMLSMLRLSVPLERPPETEGLLAWNTIVTPLLRLEVAQPEKKYNWLE